MKLYLGNNQDIELDVDEEDTIYLSPTCYSVGGCYDVPIKNGYRVDCWDGTKKVSKIFKYNGDKETCFTNAKEFFESNNKNKYGDIIEIKAKDIDQNIMDNFRYIQPSVDYPEQPVPLDPYLFGLWIGDGTASEPHITNIDEDVIKYLYKYAEEHGFTIRKDNMTYCFTRGKGQKNPLLDSLRDMGVYKNKHIPKCYLENSKEIRLRLLAGIVDTDGNHATKLAFEVTQKSNEVARDLKILANSLGFVFRSNKKEACATNTVNKTMHVYNRMYIYNNLNTPAIPTQIPRKVLDKDQVKNFHGIKISLVKEDRIYKNMWTDEMKTKFMDIVAKYTSPKGRVNWTEMVKNEPLYTHLTNDALRARHTNIKKNKASK